MAKKTSKKQAAPRGGTPTLQGRLAAHRPPLERLFFILALLGVLVTAHLAIWYGAPETQADDPVCGIGFDCQAVIASDPAPLGVPSAVWGLLFYLAVAALCLGIAFLPEPRRLLLKKARVGLIGIGLLYSLFLTGYQFFSLSDRCLLCLISATIVLLLAVVQGVYLFQKTEPARGRRDAPAPAPSYKLYGGLAGVLLVLVLADFVYYGSTEKTAAAGQIPVAEARDIDVATQCQFDESKPVYANFELLVDSTDAYRGPAGAPVTIIEYFDPNCPHCKTAYPVLKAVAERHPDAARIVYKPVAIMGQQSITQVAALHAAVDAGKFFEMLELQFAGQQPSTGFTLDELRKFARQIGMDDEAMARRIRNGDFRDAMQKDSDIFRRLGLTSVPTIILDGRTVASRSRYVECFSHFIEEALQARAPAEQAAASDS